MALIATLAALGAAGLFCLLTILAGHRLIRWCALDFGNDTEHLLYCAALGVVLFETAVFFLEAAGALRAGIPLLLAALAAAGIWELPQVYRRLALLARKILSGTRGQQLLFAAILAVLLFEGIAAMAPLTGSDALHYHFAAPSHVLQAGFHPDFFITSSFLTGQGHLLILTGLALGSEKLAMGLLYLPGQLTAAGVACLARRWVSREWALLAALAFLLNPVVFWQISTAGVPDLWMAFFAVTAALLTARARADCPPALAAACGVLAGGIAGTKYVGCIFAAAILLAFAWESRSLKRSAVFLAGALVAGIWPYARNLVWTGDPVFPFASRWLAPSRVNGQALASMLASTVVSGQRTIAHLWRFPFFAAVDRANPGFWEFFGPFCLVFLPLFLALIPRTAYWRVAVIVTLGGGLGIGLTSGMARYALPVLPVALAAAFAGAAAVTAERGRIARGLVAVTIAGFLLFSAGALAAYARPSVAAAVGLTSREDYLQQRAPDYAVSKFVNRILAGKENEGNALVFFRHVYYLEIPYVYGDTTDSWVVDPTRLATPEAWREFFRRNRIRWVVRSPEYPKELTESLEQLERNGELTPIARQDVTTFQGMRILGIRKTLTAIIFQVND